MTATYDLNLASESTRYQGFNFNNFVAYTSQGPGNNASPVASSALCAEAHTNLFYACCACRAQYFCYAIDSSHMIRYAELYIQIYPVTL